MSLQSRVNRFMPRVSLLAFLAALGVLAWSATAQAHMSGVIGYGYQGRQGPPPGFGPYCTYTHPLDCSCPLKNGTGMDKVDGCSNVSPAEAKENAEDSCRQLCGQAWANPWGNPGGIAGRPGGSDGGEVKLEGAGTLTTWEPGGYVGYLPDNPEPIGPTWEKERLAEALVQRTTVPWVWLEGMGESIQWEDSRGSAAFVQAYWSKRGVPGPIGLCRHSVQLACPLEDVRLGDSIQVCSAESETDAQRIAQTSCAPLRYHALSRSWGTWALYGSHGEGPSSAPAATVVAVGTGQFLGYIPSSLKVVGLQEDWAKLADELLARTGGTTVWLAGPARFYAPQAE